MAQFTILLSTGPGASQADNRIAALAQQTLTDWKCYLIGSAEVPATGKGDSRISVAPAGLDSLAKLMNWATRETDGDYILPLPEGIILHANALEKIAAKFKSDASAAIVYASYSELDANGKKKEVILYPHEGAIHERFDFGFVRAYRADRLRDIGGFRTDLVHAAEYDVDLKLGDKYTLALVEEPLYDVEATPAVADEGSSGALHAPGKGKLGGFSYVFYPPDLEAEITSVFEEMLKRRGVYIDHDTVPVAYPKEPYPVMGTVVIPVLNRAKFIGNAIEQLLKQTFKDWEVVVVDNGSTDGTQDVVRTYEKKDPRVKLLQRGGKTIASALNEGIRNARGKYICQLDSDDEYYPQTLEKMVGHFESHPKCGLAISYYELMDENRGEVKDVDPVTHKGYTRNQILRREGAGALRVFPKVVLEEMGYYDEDHFGNFGEDYDMVLKTGEKYDVDRVHEVLYRYRRHSDNTDVTRDPLMKIQNKNNARLNALKRRKEINKRLGKS